MKIIFNQFGIGIKIIKSAVIIIMLYCSLLPQCAVIFCAMEWYIICYASIANLYVMSLMYILMPKW